MTEETPRDHSPWRRGAATWSVFLAFYLLLAGAISTNELLAGIPAAAAASCFAIGLHRVEERRTSLRGPWPRLLLRPLAALLPDAVKAARILLRAIARRPDGPVGLPTRQPFREGTGPRDAGRRGLVTLATSLAPNGYVLAVGPDALILHRLAPAPPRPDREWPL